MIPRDPIILLSFVNLKLRDFYPSLDAFCASELDYEYNEETNQFTTHWGDYAYPDERPKYPWET